MKPYDLRRHSRLLATILVIGAIAAVSLGADRPSAGQPHAQQPGGALDGRGLLAEDPTARSEAIPDPASGRGRTSGSHQRVRLAAADGAIPPEAQFFLPGGQVIKGRDAVGDLFKSFVRPVSEGGLCGLKFETETSFPVGDTINVQWVARASFLAEPYRGADAYVTRDGLMMAQVTTFDAARSRRSRRPLDRRLACAAVRAVLDRRHPTACGILHSCVPPVRERRMLGEVSTDSSTQEVSMRSALGVIVVIGALAVVPAAAQKDQTWKGAISDSNCNGKHPAGEHDGGKMTDVECTNVCMKKGAKYLSCQKARSTSSPIRSRERLRVTPASRSS